VSADALYKELTAKGIEVLYDDRAGVTAGEKFNDSDLLGIPTRIVISKKTLAAQKFEVKDRATGEVRLLEDTELRAEIFG
jgi:prolyl-tRNA synthetase